MFHGSMPDLGSSSADTFHVAEAEKIKRTGAGRCRTNSRFAKEKPRIRN
jgi:hypothetical protein